MKGGVAANLEHGDAIKVNESVLVPFFAIPSLDLRVSAVYFPKMVAGGIATRDIYLMSICSHNFSNMDNNTS